jgi:2-oxoglutarate ferredoxin oxidoreductase subunit alpha
MGELLGLAYYAEIPAVIIDVQRTGPSTGMPTRTQQSDILACAYASHGDTKHVLLFPANPHECFTMAIEAFDLAERFQTPVMMLSDLDIGMNDWVCPRLRWDDGYRPDRGRVLTAEELQAAAVPFARYSNENADQVAARTLPGVNSKGAFFTRGSGHNRFGAYTEIPDEYQEVMDRLLRKHRAAAHAVPKAVRLDAPALSSTSTRTRPVGIITLGGCDPAVREAIEALGAQGVPADYLRIRAFPFGAEVLAFLEEHERIFIVEQNRDAQLRTLLTVETPVSKDQLRSILVYGGFPLSSRHVVDGVLSQVEH